jgi:NAD(P)-dependent dehydrogenase (short-subunit alcohol dehydrogenase family)
VTSTAFATAFATLKLNSYRAYAPGSTAIADPASQIGYAPPDRSPWPLISVVRDNPELNKRIADMTALGRTGLPDDIGPMIASLLSEDNRWINAQRIEVSGGMSI